MLPWLPQNCLSSYQMWSKTQQCLGVSDIRRKMVCKIIKDNYTAELQSVSIVTSDFQWEHFTSDHPSHRSGHDIQERKTREREDKGREKKGRKEGEREGTMGVKGRKYKE